MDAIFDADTNQLIGTRKQAPDPRALRKSITEVETRFTEFVNTNGFCLPMRTTAVMHDVTVLDLTVLEFVLMAEVDPVTFEGPSGTDNADK